MASLDDILKLPPKGGPGGGKVVSLDELVKLPPATERKAEEPDAPALPGDEVTGRMRLAVGTARDRDKLATVKQYFPDAEPSDKGGFTFTSPTTKKKTYFNPPGFDMGDLADWARTGVEAVSGTAGGIAGGLATAGNPVGAIAGAGAGTALGGQLLDAARAYFGSPQTSSSQAVGENVTGDVFGGAAGEVGGQLIGKGIQSAAKAFVQPGAAETVAAAQKAGLPLTARMVGRRGVVAGETGAANVLPGSLPYVQANRLYDTAARKIEALKPDLPPGMVEPGTVAEAAAQGGDAIKQAAARHYDDWKAQRTALDAAFSAAMPPGVRIKLPLTAQATGAMQAKIARAPGSLGPGLKPVNDWAERIATDLTAHNGAVPVDVLRTMRTQLGAELDTAATTELPEPAQRGLRDLYKALNADLKGAAAQINPDAAAKLAAHDAHVSTFRTPTGGEAPAASLDAVLKAPSAERAWNAFLPSSAGGVERTERLLAAMNPQERDVVGRAMMERLTTTPQGNKADPGRFATEWQKLPDVLRQGLFPARAEETDALAHVMRRQAEGAKGTNVSGTAYEQQRVELGKTIKNLLYGLSGTQGAGALAGAGAANPLVPLGALLGSYGTSAAMFNPYTVRSAVRAASGTAKHPWLQDMSIIKRMIAQLGAEDVLDPRKGSR